MLHPAANRHPKATHQWLLMGVQACRLPALKPLKPSKRFKPLKILTTLKTLTWHASSCSQQPPRGHTSMASYGPLKQSLGMLHPAANRHPKATHQWLLMGVQACRLPALKPSKPSKRFKPLKTLKPLKRWLGMLHPAANSHPKATHQWLLMGRLNNPLACFILQPTGTPRPHINGFLPLKHPHASSQQAPQGYTSIASYGRPSLPFKPLKTLKLTTLKTLTWHASSCSQQPPRGHTSMASYGPLKQSLGMLHPAANRHPKATHQFS